MSGDAFPLATVEAWMQAVLIHPQGTVKGLESKEASSLIPAERAGAVIREDGPLGASERLDIYAGMVPLRMREALEGDYPVLAWLVGEEAFGNLVRDYVAAHPSTSFTLARLGDRLPGFLSTWGPRRRRPLLVDVARLELAASRVFDARETASLGIADFAAIPAGDIPGTEFRTLPGLAVLRVRPGAIEALDAFQEGATAPKGSGRSWAWVVFHRQEFKVLRRSLDPFAGKLLERFGTAHSLGEALAAASRNDRRSRPAPETVSGWFRDWLASGFFRKIHKTQP